MATESTLPPAAVPYDRFRGGAAFRTALALLLILACAYLATYTGRMELGDQLEYYDAVGGVARFGLPLADEGMWQTLPTRLRREVLPLRPTIAEPLFIHAAAPLYFAAERMTGLGLVHTTWLFNIVMSPLCAALAFALALRVGVDRRGALGAALAFGLLTVWWTYSHTFFREPLMTALLLGAAITAYDIPRAPTLARRLLAAVGCGVLLLLAVITKEVVVFALPGLLLLALPARWWHRRAFRLLVLAGLAAIASGILMMIYTPFLDWLAERLPNGYLISRSFQLLPDTTRAALHTYLLSVGGSLWGTSPVLLLAVPGAWLLWRKHPAFAASALVVCAGFVVGYGLLRGEGAAGGNWFGGTIWPQRFLLPVIPFAALLTAPVWGTKSRLARVGIAVICLYSLWWQASSVAFNWYSYDRIMVDASFGLTYWLPGFNVFEHLRPVALLRAIGTEPLNSAWARADMLPYALVFLLPLALSVFALKGNRRARVLLGASAVLTVAFAYIGLRLLYDRDPLYLPEHPGMFEAVAAIRTQVPVGGVVMVNDPDTTNFWFNYGKVGRRWVVGMPYHPGDRGSFEQPVQIESPDAAVELAERTPLIIARFGELRERFWLFMDSSSDLPWARRPLERYLGERYYKIDEMQFSSYARLLSYDTTPAPAWDSPAVPQVAAAVTFTDTENGDMLELLGYTLPEGAVLTPGAVLPVSLVWRADTPPRRDYTAALFVVREDNPFIRAQGLDSWLGATFKTTSLLPAGTAVWDNRAVLIPADWQPGEYRLWVKLYFNDYATGQVSDLVPSGGDITDGTIAVLTGVQEIR